MSKKFQFSIPEPCHENWDKMEAAENGRYCGSCCKQVVDFTSMSDTQLIAFFKKPVTGSVCGRFMPDQLDRDIEVPARRLPWIKYFFQVAIPAFLISTKAQARQGTVARVVRDPVSVVDSSANTQGKKAGDNIAAILNGRVVDEAGNGIPYASITVKGRSTGVAADSAGWFSIKYAGKQEMIMLAVSSTGYFTRETSVFPGSSSRQVMVVLSADNVLPEVIVKAGGTECTNSTTSSISGVAGGVMVTRRRSSIDTIMYSLFQTDFSLKVYPNPARSNTSVSLELSNIKEGNYNCQLLSLQGQQVFAKEFWIDRDARVADLLLPSLTKGIYLLRLTNRVTRKTVAHKLMIE